MTYPSSIPSMPQAVASAASQGALVRKGTVSSFTTTQLGVRVAGASAETPAAYLPSYQPVLGDSVLMTYQDASWTVLGTFGGPMEPNTEVPNYSFELSAPGSTPLSWQLATTAGAPTFQTFTWPREDFIDGQQVGRLATAAAGTVTTEIISASIPVETSQQWACAAWVRTAHDFAPGSTCTIRLRPTWRGDASLSTPIRQDDSGFHAVVRGMPWTLLRCQGTIGLTAPAGAVSLRLQLAVSWTAAAGDALYVDRLIARRLM